MKKKTLLSPPLQNQKPTSNLKPKVGDIIERKNFQGPPTRKVLPGRVSFPSTYNKKTDPVTPIGRARTWHRADNPPLPSKMTQSASYIRKGNSLVRSCLPTTTASKVSGGLSTSSFPSDHVAKDESKSSVSVRKVSDLDSQNFSERPRTPILPHSIRMVSSFITSSPAATPPTLPHQFLDGCSETISDPAHPKADTHAVSAENQNDVSKNLKLQGELANVRSPPSEMKLVTYVKRKSNQLVASCDTEVHDCSNAAENTQILSSSTPSDQYYKKSKNQLIRNDPSLRSHLIQAVSVPDGSTNSESQRASTVSSLKCIRNMNKRRINKGERIFRIGSVRYKMDASKLTLLRIPDEKSSSSIDHHSEKDIRKSFIPKRLLIDNDEYIRIGNGNKLVRDPKKLVRRLASEKVRWSLHTARLRLAKKQQYCQFFTRFGKCNKGDGKCPYIHDPAKIAVCTKFLKGLCSDTSCKLTHKVIPERMEDCSYFLEGLCTNDSCPYRHVNVNPNASVCEGFLRGYCANGDECRKKHSYVCPVYKSTGTCPQRPICKLHHPNKTRNRKKRSKGSKNSRYFGLELSEKKSKVSSVGKNKCGVEKEEEEVSTSEKNGGLLSDFICLDVSDGEGWQDDANSDLFGKYTSDHSDEELEELVKPMRLIHKTPS
ncbi:hypothetical protein ACHQM5_022936 [Ranunculus cassubicifolius]